LPAVHQARERGGGHSGRWRPGATSSFERDPPLARRFIVLSPRRRVYRAVHMPYTPPIWRLGRICFRYPQPFPPTSGGKSADTEGCVSGVDSSSLSVAGRSPLWESGTQHKNREHRLCPASLVIRQLRSHISIHLSYNYQLPNVTTPEENDTSTSQRQSRWLSSPSGQGRQPCSQTSGRQNATTRRSHPRP
jgi:hypothetical protein